jgi:membrane protein DedA with SNARE-associated domain
MPSITSLIDHYGALAVFVFVVFENFGVPIPGETMLVVAAAYAASGHISIALVIVCCIAGVWTGCTLSYLAGRSGGVALMTRLHVPERHLARAETYMTRWGGYTVLFGRYVAFLRSYIGWLAGINRMRPVPFYLWNLAGATAWTLTFSALGYLLGNNWKLIEQKLGVGVVVIIVAAVVLYVLYKLYKRRAAHVEIVRAAVVASDETAPDAVIPAPAASDAVLTGENTGARG